MVRSSYALNMGQNAAQKAAGLIRSSATLERRHPRFLIAIRIASSVWLLAHGGGLRLRRRRLVGSAARARGGVEPLPRIPPVAHQARLVTVAL